MKRFLCAIVLLTAFLALAAPPDPIVRNPIDTAAPAPMTNIVKAIAAEMAATNAIQNLPDFTIVQMGDLQDCAATATGREYVTNSFSYLIAMKSALNIKALVLPGDLTDDGTDETMWLFITNQLARLYAAGIPFYASAGNHDKYSGSHTPWNNHMAAFMAAQPGYESRLSASDYYAASWFQTNSGIKLNFIALGYATNATDFANIAAFGVTTSSNNADHISIFLTHAYLSTDSIPLFTPDTGYDSGINGIDWWSNCFKIIPSSAQVFCGHDHPGAFARLTQYNDWGTRVDSVLFNEQDAADGGGNYMRLYRWQPNHNWIVAYTVNTVNTNVLTTAGSYFLLPITGVYPGGDFATTNTLNIVSNILQAQIDGIVIGGTTSNTVANLGFLGWTDTTNAIDAAVLPYVRTNESRPLTLTGSNDFSVTPSFGQTLAFRGSVGAGDGKIMVVDQVTSPKQMQTASGMGATNGNLWVQKGVTAGFINAPSTNQQIMTPTIRGHVDFTDAGAALDTAILDIMDDGGGAGMFVFGGDATPIVTVSGSLTVSNQTGVYIPLRINAGPGHSVNLFEVDTNGTALLTLGPSGNLILSGKISASGNTNTSLTSTITARDANGAEKGVTVGANLSYDGTTLSATGGTGSGIQTNAGTGIGNTLSNLTVWNGTNHGVRYYDGTDNFEGATRFWTGSLVSTNPLFYRDAAAGDTNAIRLSGGLTATFFDTPTNSPTDAYVLTATGTGGATAWKVAAASSGGIQTNSGTGYNNILTNLTAVGLTANTITNTGLTGQAVIGTDANGKLIAGSASGSGIITNGGTGINNFFTNVTLVNPTNIGTITADTLAVTDAYLSNLWTLKTNVVLAGNGDGVLTNVTIGSGLSFNTGTYTLSSSGLAGLATNAINMTNVMTVYNVRDYGAITNDGTDDTAAFQAAINAANGNLGGGGIVYVPPGVYTLTGTITNYAGVSIIGSGGSFGTEGSVINKTGTGPAIVIWNGRCVIKGIYLHGPDKSTEVFGIRTRGYPNSCSYFILDDVRVDGFISGFYMDYAWSYSMLNCWAVYNGDGVTETNAVNARWIIGGEYSSNTNGIHRTSTGGGTTPNGDGQISAAIQSNNTGYLQDDTVAGGPAFFGCHWENNTNHIIATNVYGLSVQGGYFTLGKGTNILLHGTGDGVEIHGVYFASPAANALIHSDSGIANVTWGGGIRNENSSAVNILGTLGTIQANVTSAQNATNLYGHITTNNVYDVPMEGALAQVYGGTVAWKKMLTNNVSGIPTAGLAVPMVQGNDSLGYTNVGTAAFTDTTAYDPSGVATAATNSAASWPSSTASQNATNGVSLWPTMTNGLNSMGAVNAALTSYFTNGVTVYGDGNKSNWMTFSPSGLLQTNNVALTGRTFREGQLQFWYNGAKTAEITSSNGVVSANGYQSATNSRPYYTTVDWSLGNSVFLVTNAAFTLSIGGNYDASKDNQQLICITNSATSTFDVTIAGVNYPNSSVTVGCTNGQMTYIWIDYMANSKSTNAFARDTFAARLK